MPKKSEIRTAKYDTDCPACPKKIRAGEEIKPYNGGWVHVTCYEAFKIKEEPKLKGPKKPKSTEVQLELW